MKRNENVSLKEELEMRDFQLNVQKYCRVPEETCNISKKHLKEAEILGCNYGI